LRLAVEPVGCLRELLASLNLNHPRDLLLCPAATQAQEQPKPNAAAPNVAKPIHLPDEYRKDYDRFTDETMIAVGPFALDELSAELESGGEARMIAAIFYAGQKLTGPASDFFLLFYSKSKEWEFLRRGRLYVLADGERFSCGEGIQEREVKHDKPATERRGRAQDMTSQLPSIVGKTVLRSRIFKTLSRNGHDG
jgi:hypothetical protein